ncbi:hypothetical protein HYPSUDRAFT_206406 [Hypholoma sublateritium FD-334 SS-4]|uniref:Uncharacterized protein n=1 Tax=Hypholoma sublateritium (strain FD-334 SS-4) TaxID=945553 RepID=A0A0D2PAA3_HYPSF|nr:hypothetical protein HYPSUDRAFT_206406 [Hypholoma sublateritium FD-334 SS-4]
MSTASDTGLGGHASLSAIAAIGNPRHAPNSTKKLILDAQIYLGTSSEQLIGVLAYFNTTNLNVGLNDVALYHIECTFACFDPDRTESYPTKLSPPRYAFTGDIQKIIRLTDAVSLSDCEADSSAFPIDPCHQPYVHIAGAAVNCDKARGTFDLDVEHYISLTKPDQSNKIITPISCLIPDSPRWKLAKPVPYNKRYAFVTGLLSDVSFEVNSLEPTENRPITRFGINVDNIVFLGTQGVGVASNTFPNVLDKADTDTGTAKRLISYGKRRQPSSQAESTIVADSNSVTAPSSELVTTSSKTTASRDSMPVTRNSPPSKKLKKN